MNTITSTITNTITNTKPNNCRSCFPIQNHHLAVWPRPKRLVLFFCLRAMSSYPNLLQMLAFERRIRCEKRIDVPDHDGSKPFVFSIGGKDLLTSNRKGAHWDSILNRTKKYGLKGDLTQQFAALKEWLENDRRKYN